MALVPTARPTSDTSTLFVVKGPYRLFSNNGNDLRGVANLSMTYSKDADEAFRTTVWDLAVYQWNESQVRWELLKSTHLSRANYVSAPIHHLGLFMLAAPFATPATQSEFLFH